MTYECLVEFEGGGKAQVIVEGHSPMDAAFKAMTRCAHMFPGEGVTHVRAGQPEERKER